MRMFRPICLLAICVALAACKKGTENTAATEAPVQEVAQATPAPTPEPTPEPTPPPIDKTSQVIVFCYHRFEEKPKDSLAIKPSEFEAQMQMLKDHGIEVIPMEDFLAWRRGEKSIPPKSAVISIDDGYISGYNIAWPILKKFNYPFTMYVYTDYIKGGPKSGGQSMTWGQLEEMRDAGVDIGSHTVSHSALTAKKGKTEQQYLDWLKNEIAGSKQAIEDKLGIQVKTLAYPYGMHNEIVRKMAIEAGYEGAFTVYGQRLPFGADASMLGRYAIESTKPKVFEQAIAFTGGMASDSAAIMPAAATMLTQPMDGSTISDPEPEIKANLATLGNLDPKSVTMRLSGIGLVPATYDEKTKTISYKMAQKIHSKQVTVIVGGTSGGRKIEARWSFNYDPNAPATPAGGPDAPAAPAEETPAAPAAQ